MRLALLVSGGGTTMEQILLAVKSGRLRGVEPVLVIASKPDIKAIDRAIAAGMHPDDVCIIRSKDYSSQKDPQKAFGEEILTQCRRRQVNFIGQYGWLPLTPSNVIEAYWGRMINQHPGQLDPMSAPLHFGGKGMHGLAVHAARLRFAQLTNEEDPETEATAHYVTEDFDQGAILAVTPMKFSIMDTPEEIQQRLLPLEHELQINVLQHIANGDTPTFYRNRPLIAPEHREAFIEAKAWGMRYAKEHP